MTSPQSSSENLSPYGMCPHLNVCLMALVRRSMIFTRSSLEQVSSSVRSWFRSSDVTRPSSSSSRTMVSALMCEWNTDNAQNVHRLLSAPFCNTLKLPLRPALGQYDSYDCTAIRMRCNAPTHLMSQNRTFLSKCPLMTHCSVHTMSLQLEPANTVFIPAQVRRAAGDIAVFVLISHHRIKQTWARANIEGKKETSAITYTLCCGGPIILVFCRSCQRRCERCPIGSELTALSRCDPSTCAGDEDTSRHFRLLTIMQPEGSRSNEKIILVSNVFIASKDHT